MKIIRIYSFYRHSPFPRVTRRREQKLKIKIISWPPDDFFSSPYGTLDNFVIFFPALALKQIEKNKEIQQLGDVILAARH